MVLDAYRRLADAVLNPIARRLVLVSPNALSWSALAFAALAAVSFYAPSVIPLALGAALVILSGLFDALDGGVAKITRKTSPRGDFLDHVLDRYGDVLMLAGIAFGPYSPAWLGLLAIVGVLLTSYMGTQAQAVGAGRHYGGALGRADRLVILFVAVLLQAALDPLGSNALGSGGLRFTYIGWAMALFAVLGNITAIQRAVSTWRRLS